MDTKYIEARMIKEENGWFSLEIVNGEGEKALYKEISKDAQMLEGLAEAISLGQVSQIHIEEIIEDILQ